MKRWISLLLILALAISLAACGAPAQTAQETATPAPAATTAVPVQTPEVTPAPAEENDTIPLPALGDEVDGFVVREIRDFPMIGGTAVLFEHEKTGAELMYIANSDTNRYFDLTFFTRAIDNTGLPHVFEHSTLSGSDKYPSKSLFFSLSNQTYNTYMNAATYPDMTTYPVGSLSEEQLLRYADFYTDSCLHPSILHDESIYREEAWRYRMADAESDLTIEGTVYSEMLAAMNLSSSAMYNMLRLSFPGSVIGNVSGGDPADIPDMTWDALKEYHAQYYHPSNCIGYLYGEFRDYTAFLKLLDEAFSPYEKREFRFADEGYEPLTAPVEESFAYAMEAGSDTENRSAIYYSFVCPGLKGDPEEELLLNTLTDLLYADASPLIQSLKKALPAGSFACYIETEGPEDAIEFVASNVNPEDKDVFKETVDAVLADVAENGFAQDLVDGLAASLSLSMKLTREGSDVGEGLIADLAYSYASSGDPFDYMNYVEALENLDDWNSRGLYRSAVQNWLLNSSTTALAVTYPAPGLREELDAAEAQRLAEVKAAMSDEELQAVIDATNAPMEEDDASAYVAQLQAVTVSSLPEETQEYAVKDATGADGVRRLTAEAGVDGVGRVVLLLDASGLAQEDIHWFALYTALLGEMDTAAHSSEELATLTTRYLYSGEVRLSLPGRFGTDEYTPYLRAGWISADEDLEPAYELMYEILFDTDFSDTEKLLGLVQQNKAALKSGITGNPLNAVIYRSLGALSPVYAYYDNFNYLNYYAFLEETEALVTETPEAAVEKLRAVQEYFHNRTNAIAAYAGSAEGIAANVPLLDAFLAKLDAREIVPTAYEFPKAAASYAMIVDSNVQYNGIIAGYGDIGLEGYSADLDAVAALVNDTYLLPQLRDQYGVYTPAHAFLEDAGAYLITYRDPNILETFEVYAALPDFLAELEIDQETLDGYILSSYAYYAMPSGELAGAMGAILDVITETPADQMLTYMRTLKALTPEKLQEFIPIYEGMIENGLYVTAGGAAAINANAEFYEEILNPFGAVDASEVEFTDVSEGAPHYEAVRFVYEYGLMAPAADDRFGVDDGATQGELAGALYGLIGGDVEAQEDAIAFLSQFAIFSATAKTDDPLTGVEAQRILTRFSLAADVDFTSDSSATADALTRGELAEVLMAYVEPLI